MFLTFIVVELFLIFDLFFIFVWIRLQCCSVCQAPWLPAQPSGRHLTHRPAAAPTDLRQTRGAVFGYRYSPMPWLYQLPAMFRSPRLCRAVASRSGIQQKPPDQLKYAPFAASPSLPAALFHCLPGATNMIPIARAEVTTTCPLAVQSQMNSPQNFTKNR